MQQELEIPKMLISRLTNIAILYAQEAGSVLKKAFGSSLHITSKEGKHNLVTEYDSKIENMIISSIRKVFPNHIFLGEESGEIGKDPQAIKWLIDPIDGTVNFAHSIPIFCVSIAATFQDRVLSGVIYDPLREEMFIAEKGYGAFLNGSPIKVSSNALLSDAILATGFPYNVAENPGHCIDHFVEFVKLGLPLRRLGSAALDIAYVACGRFDGFWEVTLNPWDYAAASLILEEAGGKISDYSNNVLNFSQKSSVIASNSVLHKHIQTQINQAQAES